MRRKRYLRKSKYNLATVDQENTRAGKEVLINLGAAKGSLHAAIKYLDFYEHIFLKKSRGIGEDLSDGVHRRITDEIATRENDYYDLLIDYTDGTRMACGAKRFSDYSTYRHFGIPFCQVDHVHLFAEPSCQLKYPDARGLYADSICSRRPSCCLEYVFDNLILLHSGSDHLSGFVALGTETVSKYIIRKCGRTQEINRELRELRQELRTRQSKQLIVRVRELASELHGIIAQSQFKQYSHLKKSFQARCRIIQRTIVRDIRRIWRQIIHIIFKNLPDLSGCEEETRFISTLTKSKPVFLMSQLKNHVRFKTFNRRLRFSYRVGWKQTE